MSASIKDVPCARESGFTFADLLIATVALCLLLIFLVPRIGLVICGSKLGIVKATIVELERAAKGFHKNNDGHPASLELLVTADSQGAKYFQAVSVPKDPWGREYTLEIRGDELLIWTLGADRKVGGSGANRDISNVMIANREI